MEDTEKKPDESMEKYAVVTEEAPKEKTAAPKDTCPKCGSPLNKKANVPHCTNCGSKPFEVKR